MHETILERAQKIIYERAEDKERQYGPIQISTRRTAKIATLISGIDFTEGDVLIIMIASKLSREAHCHKEDNLLDAVGYISALNDLFELSRNKKEGAHDDEI